MSRTEKIPSLYIQAIKWSEHNHPVIHAHSIYVQVAQFIYSSMRKKLFNVLPLFSL